MAAIFSDFTLGESQEPSLSHPDIYIIIDGNGEVCRGHVILIAASEVINVFMSVEDIREVYIHWAFVPIKNPIRRT